MKDLITLVVFFVLYIVPMASIFFAAKYVWNNVTVLVPNDFDKKTMTFKYERHFSWVSAALFPAVLRDDLLAIVVYIKRLIDKWLPSKSHTPVFNNTCEDADFVGKRSHEAKSVNVTRSTIQAAKYSKATTNHTAQKNKPKADQDLPKATKYASGDFG